MRSKNMITDTPTGPIFIEKICRCGNYMQLQLQDGIAPDIAAMLRSCVRYIMCPQCGRLQVPARKRSPKREVRLPYVDN